MPPSVTRRAFVGTVLGAGALAVPLARSASAGAATNTLYALSADWGAGDPNCVASPCGGCYACVNHARNKIFASAAAADAGRAHARCKCVVTTLFAVDTGIYDRLFRSGPSVDRRTPGISALLDRSASVPVAHGTTPASGLPLTGASLVPLALGGASAVAFGALLWRAGRIAHRPTSEVHDHGDPETVHQSIGEASS